MGAEILNRVFSVICDRKRNPKERSYVCEIFSKGIKKIEEKIDEEAKELCECDKSKKEDVIHEATDLIFHILLLLGYLDIDIDSIFLEFEKRFGISGIEEKERRKR